RVIITESYSDIKDTMGYYGSSEMPGVHFPLNFVFITKLNNFCEAEEVKNAIKHWMTKLPKDKSANWVLGNHDVPRVAARFGPSLVDAFNMLLMVLPGVAVTYNGEEIGMEDTSISWEQTKDPNGLYVGSRRYTKFSRDPQRTPFQWDTSTSAGFSSNTSTWLPVNDNYLKLNLQSQKLAKESHYHVYKRLVQARRSATLQKGDVDIQVVSKYVLTIFSYVERWSAGVGRSYWQPRITSVAKRVLYLRGDCSHENERMATLFPDCNQAVPSAMISSVYGVTSGAVGYIPVLRTADIILTL
ncbi:unnamed protein product, partial [Timema podura]|nr:unnamed protein product [Timema podura]